jgi:predicted metal-dependent phosphoesterase TrpH
MNRLKFETHCHSDRSNDSLNKLADLIRVAKKKNISRLAITDHNRIDGAIAAKEMAPDLIIVGEEILTTKGELLVFFVKEVVPSGLSPMEAIERLRDQNAFISVSHPFDTLRSGWEIADLKMISPFVDAIEIFNARCFSKRINEQAIQFANENNLNGTVGSDAHTIPEVGKAVLSIPEFFDADTLRQVLPEAAGITNYSSPLVRFGSSYARLIRKIKNQYE